MAGQQTISPAFVSEAPKLGFVGGLDGVRAIAVVLVLGAHSLGVKAGSFVGGVDVFMVVSGFLISTLLLQEHRSTGTISLRSFYIRRGLRLLPPLYVVLLFTMVISFFVDGGKLVGSAFNEVAAAFFYVYHVVFAGDITAVEHPRRFLPQLWSLSVEEHFYLVIGVVFLVVIRRNWVRQFAVAASLFIIVGAISRLTNHYGPFAFWLQRPDSLMVGVVAAIVNSQLPDPLSPRAVRALRLAATAGLALALTFLVASSTIFNKLGLAIIWTTYVENPEYNIGTTWFGIGWTQIGFTAIALGMAPVVIALVRLPTWPVQRLLSIKPLRYVGRLSYTIYIWHVPMGIFVLWLLEDRVGDGLLALLLLGSIFGVSVLSYRFIERPALRLKMRWSTDPDAMDLSKQA